MSSKTTATKENALSKQEVDDRLGATPLARMATYRPDGMIHLTPIWYHWNGEQFRLTLGAGRIHLKNLVRTYQQTNLMRATSSSVSPVATAFNIANNLQIRKKNKKTRKKIEKKIVCMPMPSSIEAYNTLRLE